VKRILIAASIAVAAAACKKAEPAPVYIKVPVERRDIVVAASAAGAIQPILNISVKSQASGQVTEMHVQTGDEVRPGQLLALIDPRLPKSALDQAQASLDQAQAQYDYAAAQLAREDTLFKAKVVAEQEYQNTKVSFEQAKAALVNARSNLDDAKIAYDQTRVVAPLAGTIISKSVDVGTVIASTTHDVSGGTTLFQMANLDTVQVQGMVDETDIGKIQPGLPVTITVDAYPNRPFEGNVLKIEPLATVNQNVTMFPVDVNIYNPGHLLKPGMNTEVEIHVGNRPGVLAIPNSALRTQRDVASAATVLGLDPQAVQQQLAQAQTKQQPESGRASMGGVAPTSGDGKTAKAGGKAPVQDTLTTPDGRRIPLPPGVSATMVQTAFRKRMNGETLTPEEQNALSAMRKQFSQGGGGFGGGRGGAGGGGGMRQQGFGANQSYIVFTMKSGKITPVPIRTGLTDLDYIEVTTGLSEGDTVLVLPSASLVQAQEQFKQRFQNMTGGGLPGLRQQGSPSSGGAGAARTPGR